MYARLRGSRAGVPSPRCLVALSLHYVTLRLTSIVRGVLVSLCRRYVIISYMYAAGRQLTERPERTRRKVAERTPPPLPKRLREGAAGVVG